VVAGFYPLAEVARQVGGDAVAVTDLTPADAEAHDLELTPGQVTDIEDADVVVVMGRGFQPALEDAADRAGGTAIVVLDELDDANDSDDPHVWLDPTLMRKVVALVEDALTQADPDNAATYEANARRYATQLDELDAEYEAGLARCDRREIITAHDAFGWLARRYDLEQHAIAGISPEDEPSADRVAELSDLAEATGATTIFTETLVSPDVAETVAREAGGLRTDVLNPIEGLTDAEVDAGADYLSLMRDNLSKLQEALGCS
jgi:zinc transport system substrate-binding protein